MNLVQLQAFETVARAGTFTAAAELLFVTQPSLSRQIGTLEADLGAALFRRGRSGATLTEAGNALLPIARRMLADAETARDEMSALAGLTRGRVRIGAPPTLCASVVAEVLADFRSRFPGVALEIRETGSRALTEALGQGRLDLALTVDRGPVGPNVVSEALFTEELVVARAARAPKANAESAGSESDGSASAGPEWDTREVLTLAELAELPQVAFGRHYDLRQSTDVAFGQAGLSPRIAVEGAEMDAVLRFVERGVGVAVVPATILLGRPGLAASRLVEPSLTRTVALSVEAGVALDPASQQMRKMLVEKVAELTGAESEFASLVTAV